MSGSSVFNPTPWYTPLFVDLIDNYNQNVNQFDRPTDLVTGYSISDLQSFLIAKPTNWYMYRDHLQNNSNNPNEPQAIQIFSDYD